MGAGMHVLNNDNNNEQSKNFYERLRRKGIFHWENLMWHRCFCSRPDRMLIHSMRGNPNVRATGNGAWWHAGKF